MPKPIDIPPDVARVFVGYMRAYHAEKNQIKRDAIAAEVKTRLEKYLPPRAKTLRLIDIRELFQQSFAGPGYWYFVFDDKTLYDTHSVFVMRLSDLPLERWIEEEKDFLNEMKGRSSRGIEDNSTKLKGLK